MQNDLDNIHPGEILSEEFLIPLGISQNGLAAAIDVPANRINAIVRQRRRMTADTALRLARYFETSPEFWMNLQARFDLEESMRATGGEVEKIRPLSAE